ncbi:MlaD family protein [Salidesulfovibrio onnuriiensis]|uniref:MlaD family protein n=1 Tax=Salidesulfovibrio onnuriiensis TaxID=2583823 RepID=UPI0011C889D5|nr:MlaD family protein [Salidesulfovibrio onnuriiensis]
MRQSDYFKLGVFVILGTAMILVVILVLGVGDYFKETYTMETYIDESVNGLEVGSPVKLKGVQVGSVAEISFVSRYYDESYRYVYVRCELDAKKFHTETREELASVIEQDVKKGLRAQPTSLGLTGQLFLNLDYVNPKTNTPLKISWQPQHIYVPSAPSTLSRLEQAVASVGDFLSGLKKEDIETIVADVKAITQGIRNLMKKTDMKELGKTLIANLNETHRLLARVNELLKDPATERIIPDASGVIASARRILESSEADMVEGIADAREAMASLKHATSTIEQAVSSPEMKKNLDGMSQTLANVNQASEELRAAVRKLHAVLARTNNLVAGQQINIEAIMSDTRLLIQNLKELSEDAKRYPSGVIFGEPPAKVEPGAE